MKFCLLLIAAANATTIRQMSAWPGAYREGNNDGVDVNYGQSAHATPSMITANRAMPGIAGQANERKAPLYPYNTIAAGHVAA